MEIFWNIFFWMSLVGIVGIIGWVIVSVVNRLAQSREVIAGLNCKCDGKCDAMAAEKVSP